MSLSILFGIINTISNFLLTYTFFFLSMQKHLNLLILIVKIFSFKIIGQDL